VTDPFDLQRFVDAQQDTYVLARDELRRGRKTGHWMWFIFPQIQGLGFSAMARRYAISGRKEAEAYLSHAALGPRLIECTELVIGIEGRSVQQIFGAPDDLKFRSCMTLFAQVAGEDNIFQWALEKYFAGEPDSLSLERL
jgi:uncharacterized protein (DUF1810 family)